MRLSRAWWKFVVGGLTAVTAMGSSAQPVAVQEFHCDRERQVRLISVRIDREAQPISCDVRYQKLTEINGHDQVLWRATNGIDFCQEKARSLQAKLEGWGWRCAVNVVTPTGVAATQPSSPRGRDATSDAPGLSAVQPAPSLGSSDTKRRSVAAKNGTKPESIAQLGSASASTIAIRSVSQDASTETANQPGALAPRIGSAPAQSADGTPSNAKRAQVAIDAHARHLRESLAGAFGYAQINLVGDMTVTGDVDGDGDQDTVVTYLATPKGGGAKAIVSVFLNEGEQGYRHGGSWSLGPMRWPDEVRIDGGRVILASTAHPHGIRAKQEIFAWSAGRLVAVTE